MAFFLYDLPESDFLPGEDGFFLILKNCVVGKGTEFHMQNALNNIMVCYKPWPLILVLLICSLYAQAQADTTHINVTYLPREQSKLVLLPQKYLLSPQTDVIVGTSRVYKGDRSGMGYSVTSKGTYQVGNYWHLNMGLGFTQINSHSNTLADTLPGIHHYVNIVHVPIGLSFIVGDDRAQAITTLDLLPSINAGSSIITQYRKLISWGASTEFGFVLRVQRNWHAGLTGKFQVFNSFDRRTATVLPQYGFAGVGIMVRFSY